MSTNYRPQGSEKIQDPDKKLDRIKEIAGIVQRTPLHENSKLNTKFSTVLHEAIAADGNTYGLIQEGPKVFLKRLVNDHYDYMTGDEKDYAYKDFATAFKHMNFVFKDISQISNHSSQINIFEGGLTEKKNLTEKFILKTPQAQPPVSQDIPSQPAPPMGQTPPLGGAPSAPAQDPQASQQLGQEIGDVEGQVEDQDPVKAMQKLVGKLTEKMRTADEQVMTSEFMKSILNSVISAIDVKKLEDGDLLSVIKKLKGEGNPEEAGGEAQPSSQSTEFQDNDGIDYNVNNPANAETTPPVTEEINEPTWEGNMQSAAIPPSLAHILQEKGYQINDTNVEELVAAVNYFLGIYGGQDDPSGLMSELEEFVQSNGLSENIQAAGTTKYHDLGMMGQDIVDQLEDAIDPSEYKNQAPSPQNTNNSFQAPTSNTGKLSFTGMNESKKSFLKDKIMEALQIK